MIAPLHGARSIEFDDAIFGQHGCDALDPKLGSFLHDEIHALAARDALYQMDLEW